MVKKKYVVKNKASTGNDLPFIRPWKKIDVSHKPKLENDFLKTYIRCELSDKPW